MSKGSLRSILEQLTYQECRVPLLLFTSDEQQIDRQTFKNLILHVIQRKGVDFNSLFSHLDRFLGETESREPKKTYVPCGLVGNSYRMQVLRKKTSTDMQSRTARFILTEKQEQERSWQQRIFINSASPIGI